MTHEQRTMVVVVMTITTGWIAFAMPTPIFAPLFLDPAQGLVPATMAEGTRTVLLGIAVALYPFGQIIGSPLLGRWSDRAGRATVLQATLWATVLGSGIVAAGIAIGSIALLFLGRFVSGLAEGNLAIAQSIAADVSSPRTKARNFALIGISVDVGFIVGPLLGGVLSDRAIVPWFGAVLPFWVATGLFVLNALAVPVFLKETSPQLAVPAAARPARAALRDPRLRRVYAVSFLTFWSIMIFFDFFTVYFVQLFRTPPAELGLYMALLSAPLIAAGLLVNRVVNRCGVQATGLLSVVLMGGGLAWFVVPGTLAGLILPMVVISVGISFGQTATSVMVSDAAPAAAQGEALGTYRAIVVAAAGLAALVGGALSGLAPPYPFYTAIASAALAALVLALNMRCGSRSRRRA